MRFLVSEKNYERPVAAGRFRYERDGVPTGTLEHWRWTRTAEEDRILRVDLDARANDGDSFLYHLLLDAEGKPQRLTYRWLGQNGDQLRGNVLFTSDAVTNSRTLGSEHFDEETARRPFFFPSTMGLSLIASNGALTLMPLPVATLDMYGEGSGLLKLGEIRPNITRQRTRNFKPVRINGKMYRTTTVTIDWGDNVRTLWIDIKSKRPLKMEREDGLVAIEARLIEYPQ